MDEINLSEAKTRVMADALKNLVGAFHRPGRSAGKRSGTMILVMRSTDNLANAKVLLAGYLNIRDLFSYDKVVLPVKALDALVASLG